MLLLCVGIAVVSITLAAVLPSVTNNEKHILWLLLMFIILPILMFSGIRPSVDQYPYEAKINLNNSKETICFKSFEQSGNTVTIEEYTTDNTHWTDFNRYDVHKSTLIIYLTDNDEKFIYQDRESKQVFNQPNQPKDIATQ